MKLLLIAAAGGLGSLARYGLSGVVQNWSGSTFPYGTTVVNLLGSLAFAISPQTRIIILVGFMGAFTTFSTLMFETAMLLQDSEWLLAAANLGVQNFIGLLAIFLGLFAGRLV
jgi:CrcB protein